MTQNANETFSKISRADRRFAFTLDARPVRHALHAPTSQSAKSIPLAKISVSRVRLLVVATALFAANCHANYWGYNGILQNQTYQLEFTPLIAQNTTYWATMSVSSIGGYGGIQQWNSSNPTTDHGGLFSIWDSTATNTDSFVVGYNPFVAFNNYSFRFGGEGTGSQLLFKWAWVLGKPYRMAWRRYVEPGNTNASYEAFYFDPYDTNALGWVWVGTIRKPVNTDGARNMQGFEGFAEAYGGNLSQVREIDIRNVWLLDLSNHWVNITSANWTDSRDPSVLTPIGGGWQHRCFDSNDVFVAANSIPMLPASDLAAIFLPYRINCGWGSTNTATSAQVAASLNSAFEPDAFWYGVSATNYTASPITVSGVASAAPSLLYQSRREGTNFGYHFFGQQPNAPCLVRLHFAETDFNSLGARVQTVLINGTAVDPSLDIRASAGAQNRALVRDYFVNAGTNGLVDVAFQSQTAGVPAVVSGIEVGGLLPQLAWHPQSVTNLLGTTVQFSATAVGTPPLSYQWRRNSTNLLGQTNTTLTLNSVTTNDTANYAIVVSNAYGSVTSAAAMLWVAALTPAIVSPPQSQSVMSGANATFFVTATGALPLSYQWFFNTNTILANATNYTLTLTNIQTSNMGSYSVIVTNALGSVTSVAATLNVIPVPTLLNLSNIADGVSQIWSGGTPGPVVAMATNWIPIATGDSDSTIPSTFILARTYYLGRVFVIGHDGIVSDSSLGQFDNSQFVLNLVLWLNGINQRKALYSTGHGEWVNAGNLTILGALLSSNMFALNSTSAPLDLTNLSSSSVLIIGNAWGAFTTNEIEAVRQYVSNGGGLLLVGLGWSWLGYHAGMTLNDYPMTQMAAPYQVGWLDGYISDPTDQWSGSPIFHTFYPNISIPRPTISKPQVTIDKAFSLLVSGESGRQYRVQASTNLVSWVDITNLISTAGSWQFSDSFVTNFPRRFYRVTSP
jgi:hypothetical protein